MNAEEKAGWQQVCKAYDDSDTTSLVPIGVSDIKEFLATLDDLEAENKQVNEDRLEIWAERNKLITENERLRIYETVVVEAAKWRRMDIMRDPCRTMQEIKFWKTVDAALIALVPMEGEAK